MGTEKLVTGSKKRTKICSLPNTNAPPATNLAQALCGLDTSSIKEIDSENGSTNLTIQGWSPISLRSHTELQGVATIKTGYILLSFLRSKPTQQTIMPLDSAANRSEEKDDSFTERATTFSNTQMPTTLQISEVVSSAVKTVKSKATNSRTNISSKEVISKKQKKHGPISKAYFRPRRS